VDRDLTLVVDVRIGAPDGLLIENDGDEPLRASVPLVLEFVHTGHLQLLFGRLTSTERLCASRPSAAARIMAAGESCSRAAASRLRIEVRFMKSSTPRPDENRALRAVGRTWFEPAT